eukprot:Blabericola_migrator_1__13539@NODE_98_length_14373_cov_122_493220_g88_i0_p12_GENE_NODE_98_length_14373_cov_122_493220_g88_i0NODE_98_length_14373_cov_122_493220_g88_i0_p12_ORF_typecomplete_len114_score8_68IMUP/PF15761_5/0_2_NODE_98_length_14373_cov_122_493220_g88_i01398214323
MSLLLMMVVLRMVLGCEVHVTCTLTVLHGACNIHPPDHHPHQQDCHTHQIRHPHQHPGLSSSSPSLWRQDRHSHTDSLRVFLNCFFMSYSSCQLANKYQPVAAIIVQNFVPLH